MLPTDRSLSFINCVVWEGAQSKRSQLVGLVCPMSTLYVCERVHFLFFLSFPSLLLFFFFFFFPMYMKLICQGLKCVLAILHSR